MHLRQNLAGVAQIILKFYLFVFQALEHIQVLFFVLKRLLARILRYKKGKIVETSVFCMKGG